MTVCIRCKHLVLPKDGRGESRLTSWDYFCGHPIPTAAKHVDPITGAEGYTSAEGFYRNPHPLCKDINHGNCPYYEAKS